MKKKDLSLDHIIGGSYTFNIPKGLNYFSSMDNNLNLLIITSAINCLTCESVFSPDMRYLQILRTVLTAIEKIPNPYIVVIDT
jgi:hypothetical protein